MHRRQNSAGLRGDRGSVDRSYGADGIQVNADVALRGSSHRDGDRRLCGSQRALRGGCFGVLLMNHEEKDDRQQQQNQQACPLNPAP